MDEEIQHFILSNIANHPKDIVKLTMNHFAKSRPGIIYHLDQLLEKGLIRKRGEKNKTIYSDEQNQILYFEKECSFSDLINNTELKKFNLKIYYLMIKKLINETDLWSCEIKKNQQKVTVHLKNGTQELNPSNVLEEIKKIQVENIVFEFNHIKIQKKGMDLVVGSSSVSRGVELSWDLQADEVLSLSFVDHIDMEQLKINVEKYLLHKEGALKLKEVIKDKKEVMFNFLNVENLSAKFIELEFISLISRYSHVQFYITGVSPALKFFLQLELSKTALAKNVIWVKEKNK